MAARPEPDVISLLAEYQEPADHGFSGEQFHARISPQQRHKIIPNGVALVSEESVSVVTVGTAPAQTGDPTHAHLHHWQ
jgi:hypothetical protein